MTEQELRRWRETTLARALARAPERRERFACPDGRELQRVYTSLDLPEWDPGLPGEHPYTRGLHATMYRGRLWTMRQYAGFGTAAESNARYRVLLDRGQTGLSVAFDLPTQMGYDSDHPMARGEVGRVGVAIDSIADMRALFDGIPLDRVSTSMTINSTAATLLALYVAVAGERGVPLDRLRGTVQNDILKEYIARGTWIYPPRPSMRLVTDLMSWCARKAPRWNTISISGYHVREAGCTAAQELGFTLADGIAYVEAALTAGLELDVFAPRLSFFFNAHSDFLEEIAKFRAARRLWARIMKDRFGAREPRSMQLRFHTQTAGSTLTAVQPDNNVVRVAIQALAAVLGGTQSLHTNSRDEALGLPSEESATLALRTQQVIACETGAANVVDPLGGSYAIEALTSALEEDAGALIDRIDSMGGMVAAIEEGFPQREIQRAAYAWQLALERGEVQVVGLNAWAEGQQPVRQPELRLDPGVEREQVERVRRLRSERDGRAVGERLDALRQAAAGDANLVEPILDAVRVQATTGEVAGALREVFGSYRESVTL